MKKQTATIIALPFDSCGRAWTRRLLILLQAFFIFLPSLLFSQTLDDFRSAAAADGVNVIPFPDLRSEAKSLAEDVQKRKDEVQSYNYDILKSQKYNILEDIKKKKVQIEKIKKEIEDFKREYPDGSATSFEEEIKKVENSIAESTDKLTQMNGKLRNAADAFGTLSTAREKLRKQFDKVLQTLPDAKSSPNKYLGDNFTEEDKKKFESYIDIIEDEINSNVEEHQKQEDGARGTKEAYEELIKITEV